LHAGLKKQTCEKHSFTLCSHCRIGENQEVVVNGQGRQRFFYRLSFPRLFQLAIVALSGIGLVLGLLLLNNNFDLRPLSKAEFSSRLEQARQAARDWVFAKNLSSAEAIERRRDELFQNVMLLHMLNESARLAGDEELHDYAQRSYYYSDGLPSAWLRLLDSSMPFEAPSPGQVDDEQPELYKRWFLYSISGENFGLTEQERGAMFSKDGYSGRDLTHQVLALYLYCRFNKPTPEIQGLIDYLSKRIAREESFAICVNDLYLQRLACLLVTGNAKLVKPRWAERAIANQKPDGGWTWSWHLGLGGILGYRWPTASHPTAQGMWVLYQLKFQYPAWIDAHFH
jgi:hypothetical protein